MLSENGLGVVGSVSNYASTLVESKVFRDRFLNVPRISSLGLSVSNYASISYIFTSVQIQSSNTSVII